jgi:putative ABC transport system ATP-binding protein
MPASLHIKDLRFSWPGSAKPAVDVADWRLPEGSRTFLYGPSGSGKTSPLNLICGIHRPDSGCIQIAGTNVGALSARRRDRSRAQHIGIIFQTLNLLPYLSTFDDIRLGQVFGGNCVPGSELKARAAQLLGQLSLPADVLNKLAWALSTGQQQRVAIARALIHEPALIVADEPTSELDAAARDDFISTLLPCAALHNSTVIVVSHDLSIAPHFDQHVELSSINRGGRDVF